MPKLVIISGPMRGRECDLEDLCILGRGSNCHIYLGDLIVSRQHAQVIQTSDGYKLQDLDSGNGTFVNNQRVIEHILAEDDEIRIGDSVLRFLEESDPPLVEVATIIASSPDELIHAVAEARPLSPPKGKRTKEELRTDLTKAHRMLETVYSVADATSSVLEPTQLFTKVLDYLFDVFPDAERGFVMLRDDNNQLVPAAVRRRKAEGVAGGGLVLTQGVVAQVLAEGKAVLREDTRGGTAGEGSSMCAPLSLQKKVIGILHIEGRERGYPFNREDLLTTRLDGELRQDTRTSDMIFDVPTLVEAVTRVMTMLPGDVITTGTPSGVGQLRAGNVLEVEIEGIGALRNPVLEV